MTTIDRIFQLKNEHHLTNKALEKEAGLANSSLSQWKRGKGKPSFMNIVKLAKYFHVTTDYLLGLSEQCQPPLTEEERILLTAYHNASVEERFRIIQVCMNSLSKN